MFHTLAMDVYLLYAYVGAVCAVIIFIVLNRIKSTQYKEIIDKNLCRTLAFFIAFCIVDCLWGIIGSKSIIADNRTAYIISSYAFHFMAAWASFVCSAYVMRDITLNGESRYYFKTIRYALIFVQMILILQNLNTGTFFVIDEAGGYHSGQLRTTAFFLQFLHYLPIVIYSIIKLFNSHRERKTLMVFRASLLFSLLPLIFGFLQMLYPDGSFYSLGFCITAVAMYAFNVTDQREAFMAVYYEASEKEKSRAQIEEALEKAEAASAAKSVFLSNMSHDIRTPINGIMGMVTLAEREPMSDTLKGYIGKINVASRHLLSLVNDVLDMSRIENGRTEIVFEPKDVRTICDNCASIIRGQLENRNINFVENVGECEHPQVYADSLHLRQVLINILGNAVKFTPDAGSINFDVNELEYTDKSVTYEFKISDTGIGMSDEFIEHIFEAFSQEANNTRANYQGTGLGMAISKQLVELMGGTISVSSVLGEGSTFIVRIPFEINYSAVTDVALAEAAEKQSDADIKGVKILLAEDNELNMEIAVTLLEDAGAIVTPAENGKIACDRFFENPAGTYDIILMDLMMPEMNGFEATKAIRSGRADGAVIPIVAMTANAFEEDKKKTAEAGMNGHISKPIDFEALTAKIEELV